MAKPSNPFGGIPNVPSNLENPELLQFLGQLQFAVENGGLAGASGSNVGRIGSGGTGTGSQAPGPGLGVIVDPPTVPTNIEFGVTSHTVLARWDAPLFIGYWHTKVYRTTWDGSNRPAFDEAFYLTNASGNFLDATVQPDTRYLYWFRHVNLEGQESAVSDPLGHSADTPLPIDLQQGWISQDALEAALAERINLIDADGTGLMDRLGAIEGDYLTASALDGYVTTGGLNTTLADYVTSSGLSSTLNDYITSTGLTTTLADYVTSSALNNTLGDYTTETDFSALSDFVNEVRDQADGLEVRVYDAEQVTADHALRISGVEAYFDDGNGTSRVETLEAASADYAGRISTIEGAYMTAQDVEAYGYITSSYLTANEYVVMADLASYVTSDGLNTTLADYVTTTTLTQNYVQNSTLASYVTNTELTNTLSNYATNTTLTENYVQNSTLANYATTTALGAVDTRVGTLETASADQAAALSEVRFALVPPNVFHTDVTQWNWPTNVDYTTSAKRTVTISIGAGQDADGYLHLKASDAEGIYVAVNGVQVGRMHLNDQGGDDGGTFWHSFPVNWVHGENEIAIWAGNTDGGHVSAMVCNYGGIGDPQAALDAASLSARVSTLEVATPDYALKTELTSYVKTTDLNTTLNSYVTQTQLANADYATNSALTAYVLDDANYAAVESAATAYANNAQYMIKVEANGNVAGIGMSATDTTTAIMFSADQIGIRNPGATDVLPFAVRDNKVWMKDVIVEKIQAGFITNDETVTGAGGVATLGDTYIVGNLSLGIPGQIRWEDLSPSFRDKLVQIDPDAETTGGTRTVVYNGVRGPGTKTAWVAKVGLLGDNAPLFSGGATTTVELRFTGGLPKGSAEVYEEGDPAYGSTASPPATDYAIYRRAVGGGDELLGSGRVTGDAYGEYFSEWIDEYWRTWTNMDETVTLVVAPGAPSTEYEYWVVLSGTSGTWGPPAPGSQWGGQMTASVRETVGSTGGVLVETLAYAGNPYFTVNDGGVGAGASVVTGNLYVNDFATKIADNAGKLFYSGQDTDSRYRNASNLNSGTVPFARLPTGTSSSTVAVGNHNHNSDYAPLGGSTAITQVGANVMFGDSMKIFTNDGGGNQGIRWGGSWDHTQSGEDGCVWELDISNDSSNGNLSFSVDPSVSAAGETISLQTVLTLEGGTRKVNAAVGLQEAGTDLSAKYLGISAKASDADKLDGLDSSQFIRSDADDTVSGHTEWQDNYEIRLGTSADLRFFHNGSNSYIRNYTGTLEIRNLSHGGEISFQSENDAGTNYTAMLIQSDSNVYPRLYCNGSEKLRVFTDGVRTYDDIRMYSGSNMRIWLDVSAGNIHADADVIAASTSTASDPRLKKNIRKIDDPIGKLELLNGYLYEWIHNGLATGGVLSTEVRRAGIGGVSRYAKPGGFIEYDHVDYNAVVGLLVAVCRNLHARVKELEGVRGA